MINSTKIALSLLAAAIVCALQPQNVAAQYYTWGSDAPMKWSKIKAEDVSLIYPDTVDGVARRVLHYYNSAKNDVDFGWHYPALNIPVVMHPENFASNALVMWMPKRIDFLTTPATDSYSMPWDKQLVAHEFRHAVQYNNLNRGVVRWFSYILGEQGASFGLLFLPLFIIEGDAVKCETSMSTYGRALQPSFTMGYRAIGRDMLSRRNLDKWFCGSYLEYVPDHYRMGFQIVDYSYTKYQENIWDKVASFGVHRPYYVITTSTALKKYYGIDTAHLTREAFNNLFDFWDSLPERPNSSEIVAAVDTTNYTTYSHPIPIGDDSVIALKSSYSDPERFIKYNTSSGTEERLSHIGSLSTRPSIGGERVWWSEHRYSKLFMQKVNSQLCYMDLERDRPRTVKGMSKVLYPTAIGDSTDRLAYVEYAPNGVYSIVEVHSTSDKIRNAKDFEEVTRTEITPQTEIHSLAWDDTTENLYFIATDNSGMWLGALDKESKSGFRQLREGAYITLSDLRAKGGWLYFGSIESGYDELHCYDIATSKEYRLSQSEYGSFDPSTPIGEHIYATTYDRYGYHLARQEINISDSCEVTPANTPQNIVNPERTKWDLINLDTVDYNTLAATESHKEHKSRKYSKGSHLFNIHSWLPVAFNPFDLSAEQVLKTTVGATLVSQNLLSSTEAYASYGYHFDEGSIVNGSIYYKGLGVNLSLSATYGGDQQVYNPFESISSNERYLSLTTGASLPLLFQRGYHSRYLVLSSYWNYSNGAVLDLDNMEYNAIDNNIQITNYNNLDYNEGLHKMTFGLYYSDYVRAATRDVASPWGYAISAYYSTATSNRNFSDLVSFTTKVVTPGVLPYNSFDLSLCYQTSIGGYRINDINLLSFSSTSLLPRGFTSDDIINRNYAAASANYQLPIWYPEGGIGSILYFRRISLNLGFDAARFDNYTGGVEKIYSYGGGITLDVNPLRMPEASTSTIELMLFRNNAGELSFTMGAALPF